MKILVVEDDRKSAEILRNGLTANSHTVDVAYDGADGSFLGRSFLYDAIILDYSMPKKNGLEVCKEIRAIGKQTPIIFLSVTDDPTLKVEAFDKGANDYMVKPYSLQELYARLRIASGHSHLGKSAILKVDDLSLDSDRHITMRGNTTIRLTRKEFSLLEYLMQNIGIVISRALLMEHVWTADSDPFSNTIETHIRNLRKKINVGKKPNLILNIPGRGYVIDTVSRLKKH